MAKRIVILGAGESGAGAAVLAQKKGKRQIQEHVERKRHSVGRRTPY